MKSSFWWGTLFSCLAVFLIWIIHRLYVRVGRRCRRCNAVFKIRRISKIRLAPDETISFKSTTGKLRWWIRRVETETFAVCDNTWSEVSRSKNGPPYERQKCGWKESVKIGRGPISVWHAWWVWRMDRAQFYPDPELENISRQTTRARLNLDKDLLKDQHLDTPGIDLTPRFPDHTLEGNYPPTP